jgi:hypothetical protein
LLSIFFCKFSFLIPNLAKIFSSKFGIFLIFLKVISLQLHIDQNLILQVLNNLSIKDSLIITQVIFSTENELCFVLINSNLFSIEDFEIINFVAIIWIIL